MGDSRRPPRNWFDDVEDRLQSHQKLIESMQRNFRPTMPIYDPENFPQDPIEGQIAHGNDNTFWQYINGEWRQIGGPSGGASEVGPMPWVQLSNSSSNNIPQLANFVTFPTNDTPIYDTDVFEVNLNATAAIGLKAVGLYLLEGAFGWQNGWGYADAQFEPLGGDPLSGEGDPIGDWAVLIQVSNAALASADHGFYLKKWSTFVSNAGPGIARYDMNIRNLGGATRSALIRFRAIYMANNAFALPS